MSFQFELGGSTMATFHAEDGLVKKLLPEKISSLADKRHLVLVSGALDYCVRFENTDVEGQWEGLAELVETLSAKPKVSKVPTSSEQNSRCYCRLALYSVEPVDFSELYCSPQQKLEKGPLLMKVLILSEEEFEENTRSPEVEKGSLSKSVDRCGGPENVSFYLEASEHNQTPYLGDALDSFEWDEEQMIWESGSAYQLILSPGEIQNLIRNRKVNIAKPWNKLILCMNQAAVYEVLRHAFGNVGDDWYLQRLLLEDGGTSADFELYSEQVDKEARTPIKCHRSKLAGASQVFADMFKETSSWEEANSGTVTLPESEETIRALLPFIYYGETEHFFNCDSELMLDLLQAGDKYDIPNLVQAITFILKTKFKPELWFGVEEAVELYFFAGGLKEQDWTDLREFSYNVLKEKPRDELMTSELLYKIAEKLGPVFVSVFEKSTEKWGKQVDSAFVQVTATRQEAGLLFDLLCPSFEDKELTFGVVLGFMTLAEHSGRVLPSNYDEAIRRTFAEVPATDFGVDYLVQLFSAVRARGKKGHDDSVWKLLKEETVRKLKWYDLNQPSKLAECNAYMELLEGDFDAAMEFSYICETLEVFDF